MGNTTARRNDPTSPSQIVVFVRDRLGAGSSERFWFALAIALGLISALTFEIKVFALPSDAISNDARMFLSWMGQWDSATVLKDDFVADYWRAVSPWTYTSLFRSAWALGVSPLVFAKIFPALLFVPVAIYTFRFVRAIGGEPLIGFLVTAAVLYYLGHANLIGNSTPRAFWPLLLLMVLDGLARGRIVQTAIAQLLLTGTYPQMALTTATLIGMTLLTFSPRVRLDLSREKISLVVLSALATIGSVAPFLWSSGAYSPSFSLAEAMQIPTFGPEGRGALLPTNVGYTLFCGSRLSFLASCKGGAVLKPSLLLSAALGGSMVLFFRTLRPSKEHRLASQLPLLLALASIIWFLLAHMLLFRLHLPNRYTAATELLIYITALPLFLEWIRRFPLSESLLRRKNGQTLFVGSALGLLAICAVGAANVRVGLMKPNRDFTSALRTLPENAVIGGFVEELDFSPVLTNRSTLFSRELAVAYHKGYFLPIMGRMEAMKDILLAADVAVLMDRIDRLRMTHLVIRPADIATVRIPEEFRGFFDDDRLQKDEETARKNGPILPQLALRCVTGVYGGIAIIPTECLISAGMVHASDPPLPKFGRNASL